MVTIKGDIEEIERTDGKTEVNLTFIKNKMLVCSSVKTDDKINY